MDIDALVGAWIGELLTSRTADRERIAELERERDALQEHAWALDEKVAALSAHETCGCAYDKRDDVCSHHSPKLAKAESRISELEAQLAAKDEALANGECTFVVTCFAQKSPTYGFRSRLVIASNGDEAVGIAMRLMREQEPEHQFSEPAYIEVSPRTIDIARAKANPHG
jgi:hypothetical protein